MNKKINIVLASDENYVKLLVPCIISILYNKKPTTEIDIYILESEISEYSKQKIKQLEHFNKINNCKINFISTTNIIKENINIIEQKRFTLAIIYKLFIPKLLSQLDKALWLDADIIVRCDLLDFYNQDLNGYCLASPMFNLHESYLETKITYNKNTLSVLDILLKASKDAHSNFTDSSMKINGGVILFNIHQILKNNKQDQLINIALKYKNHLPLIDEDSLSIIFHNEIKQVDYEYNHNPISRYTYNKLTKQEKFNYENNLPNIKIFHYIDIKPHKFSKLHKLIYYKEFYKYYQMSYLKVNPIKLQSIFCFIELKALRRTILGIKEIDKNNRIFYIGKLKFKFWKRSLKSLHH